MARTDGTNEANEAIEVNETGEAKVSTVALEMDKHVAIISMTDTHRHNALTPDHVNALIAAIDKSRELGARAIVITSAVRNFCAGADANALLKGNLLNPDKQDQLPGSPIKLFAKLVSETRPVICAINGLALGGGVELALSSDLVFASTEAKFAMPEIGLGLLPRTALVKLPELIGRRRAMELILMRRKFTAQEALEMGFITAVVAPDQLLESAVDAAAHIVTAPPAAIAAIKKNLGRVPLNDAVAFDNMLRDIDEREWREGLGAFLEKREPDYERFWTSKK